MKLPMHVGFRLIVAAVAGTDFTARALGERVTEALGKLNAAMNKGLQSPAMIQPFVSNGLAPTI